MYKKSLDEADSEWENNYQQKTLQNYDNFQKKRRIYLPLPYQGRGQGRVTYSRDGSVEPERMRNFLFFRVSFKFLFLDFPAYNLWNISRDFFMKKHIRKWQAWSQNLLPKKKAVTKKIFYQSTPKKHHTTLEWVYKQINERVAFIDVIYEKTNEKKWYFVHSSNTLWAFDGDRVVFRTKFFRGREEAVICSVVQRSTKMIIWKLQIGKKFAFVLPENSIIKKDIFIPGKHLRWYTHGEEVAVQILKWEGKSPEWRIMESIQKMPKGREDIYKIALQEWVRVNFWNNLQMVRPVSIEKEKKTRQDLRSLYTFTIDGSESKDLDDALSLQPLFAESREGEKPKQQKGWRLFVHIADVTHFVPENSSLDREARKRATSIYLADQVIPMLPKKLSNELCSLHPGEDKLTLTCEMHLDLEGRVQNTQVYESIISSDYRLTYQEVESLTEKPWSSISWEDLQLWDLLQFWWKLTRELQDHLNHLKKLTDILKKNATKRWVLSFDFPETYVELDTTWQPLNYRDYPRYDSHKIIEVCMVLANEQVAKMFSKIPFLYRVHEDPDPEDIDSFLVMLEKISHEKHISQTLSSQKGFRSFSDIWAFLQKHPSLSYLQRRLLRSMAKAKYSEKNLWHFWLALQYYTHFTSPIRRYSDLQIHRIIKEYITGKTWISRERKDHYQEILPKVARQCSEMSERAEKIEYRVRDMHGCKYMQEKIWQYFTGRISWVGTKWFFVELENTIEWFVEYALSWYQMQEDAIGIVHISSGEEKYFGDAVELRLINVDMQRYKIEFDLR